MAGEHTVQSSENFRLHAGSTLVTAEKRCDGGGEFVKEFVVFVCLCAHA